MAGRISSAMERALAHVATSQNISESARVCGVDVSALRRAMRRNGEPPRKTFQPAQPGGQRPGVAAPCASA